MGWSEGGGWEKGGEKRKTVSLLRRFYGDFQSKNKTNKTRNVVNECTRWEFTEIFRGTF